MTERRFASAIGEHMVRVARDGERLRLTDDGAEREWVVRRIDSNRFVAYAQDAPECPTLVRAVRDGGTYWIHLDGHTHRFDLVAPQASAASGAAELSAPIPATVTDVIASVGDTVQQGALLVVLSAMKMQIEIRAPYDGTVASLDLAVGDSVEGGQQLVEIEGADAA